MSKYPSFLKLIFYVFTHSLQRLSFCIQIGCGPYAGKPKTGASGDCSSAAVQREWEFLHPNTSWHMCKTAVCEKGLKHFSLAQEKHLLDMQVAETQEAPHRSALASSRCGRQAGDYTAVWEGAPHTVLFPGQTIMETNRPVLSQSQGQYFVE